MAGETGECPDRRWWVEDCSPCVLQTLCVALRPKLEAPGF